MQFEHKREVAVGAVVLAAIALFIAGSLWLKGRSFGTRQLVVAEFADAGNLKTSSPVKVSGVAVGKVVDVRFEAPGKVLVSMELPPRIALKRDAAATGYDIGFLGDAAVRLDLGTAAEPLPRGQVIPGTQTAGFTGMAEGLGSQADSTMRALRALLDPELSKDLRRTLASLDRTLTVYGDPKRGPAPGLVATLDSLQILSGRLHALAANPSLGRAVDRLDSLSASTLRLSDRLAEEAVRLDSLMAGVQQGKGTLGKLATDTLLYADMRGTLQSMKALLDSLNQHPGRLTVNVKLF